MNKDEYRKTVASIRNGREPVEIVTFLQEKKILYPLYYPLSCPNIKCQNSKTKMHMANNRNRTKLGVGYRHSGCSTDRSSRTHTFLQFWSDEAWKFIYMLFDWCTQVTLTRTYEYVKGNINKIIELRKAFRLAVCLDFNRYEIRFGGPGSIVEIDESLFVRVKHHGGKHIHREQVWVFGLYDRDTQDVLFQSVPSRDASI
jgi:hypothetical protein